MTRTCSYPVRMMARAASTPERLRKIAEAVAADGHDPTWYTCVSCKLTWDCSPLDDYRQVVCSNCYSERVLLIEIRLSFSNWGKQNGGTKQRDDRWREAKHQAKLESLAQGGGLTAAAGNNKDGGAA